MNSTTRLLLALLPGALCAACVIDPNEVDDSKANVVVGNVGVADVSIVAADAKAPGAPDAGTGASKDTVAKIGPKMPAATKVFDPGGLHQVAFTVDPADWKTYLSFVGKPNKPDTWYAAEMSWDGKALGKVAIRGFGKGSQINNPAKANIRVKWDVFDPKGEGPEGLHSVRLKASGQDRSWQREPLVYDLIRDLGGHAPRWSWARIAVNGVDHGLYQVIEQADKRMYKHLFGHDDGNEYEPKEGCHGLQCPKQGCAALTKIYAGEPGDRGAIVALASALTRSDAELLAVLDKTVDLESLVAAYVVDSAVSNIDGLAAGGQNFRLYQHEVTGRLHLIASGPDLSFGKFGAWYELLTPWGKPNSWCPDRVDLMLQRLWQMPATKLLLTKTFKKLQCDLFTTTKLGARIDALAELLYAEATSDPKVIHTPDQHAQEVASVRGYVVMRQATLATQFGKCP